MSEDDEQTPSFEEQIKEFLAQNADLAEELGEITPQQQLFVELHEYYTWLKGGGFTTSESLEFLVVYLIKVLERLQP